MSHYLNIHAIQTLPYSCVNRDDTGAPKSTVYGGKNRLRVSSQSWKRATRLLMEKMTGATEGNPNHTLRTVKHAEYLHEAILARSDAFTEDEALSAAKVVFKDPKAKNGFPKGAVDGDGEESEEAAKKRVLLFLTESQYADLADYVIEHADVFKNIDPSKPDPGKPKKGAENPPPNFEPYRKQITEIVSDPRGVIRLFGRMIAHLPQANVDAAFQVAHAFSVHEQEIESDYLTAVDDEREQGAGHILAAEFSSGTLYRYANINVNTLVDENGVTEEALRPLLEATVHAFLESMPSGKASASAPQTRPSFIALEVTDAPVNFADAFEEPVRANGKGYAHKAVEALENRASISREVFGDVPVYSGYTTTLVSDGKPVDVTDAFSDHAKNLNALIDSALRAL